MKKYKYALTTNFLALRGVIYDFQSFYYELIDIVESAYQNEYKNNPSISFCEICKFDKLCKEPLDMFIQKHIKIFTYDYQHLYVNDWCLKTFSMFIIQKTNKLFHFPIRIVSFNEFLITLENLVAKALFLEIKKTKAYFSIDDALETIDDHITKLYFFDQKYCQTLFSFDNPPPLNEERRHIVWVYHNINNIKCNKKNHIIQKKTLSIPLINGTHLVKLPVMYCNECNQYFVSSQTVQAFESIYGKMLIRTCPLKSVSSDFSYLNDESELHSWGYNVIQGQATESERRNLLLLLIRLGYMSIDAICRDIENAIRIFTNNTNMQSAINKWERDLVFVRELTIEKTDGHGKLSTRSQVKNRYSE